jgi:ferredoxin
MAKILKKDNLAEFISSLAEQYQVIAPVMDEGRVAFRPVDSAEPVLLEFQNSYLSPKDLFFPQSERMFEFSVDPDDPNAHRLQEVPPSTDPRVVFGMRPCDAKALQVLDLIFQNDEYTDPYWAARRQATTIIGLACNEPCPTCFCTSVNCGPFHEEGLDALAVDLGDQLLITPLTDKGQQALDRAKGLEEPSGKVEEKADSLKAAAMDAIESEVPTNNVFKRSVMELFDAEHWDREHESCLNCGTCTFVCPTCHCFDIQDEVEAGRTGDRIRNWDSCMSWLFTMHGSGHNPRAGKKERVRQRFMHKFKYIPLKRNGEIGCVGCGRCVNLCPVNIDVRDVVRHMNS